MLGGSCSVQTVLSWADPDLHQQAWPHPTPHTPEMLPATRTQASSWPRGWYEGPLWICDNQMVKGCPHSKWMKAESVAFSCDAGKACVRVRAYACVCVHAHTCGLQRDGGRWLPLIVYRCCLENAGRLRGWRAVRSGLSLANLGLLNTELELGRGLGARRLNPHPCLWPSASGGPLTVFPSVFYRRILRAYR